MKRLITTIALVSIAILAFAQKPSVFRPRIEVATVEADVDGAFVSSLEVFYMNDENPRTYYLSLGNLGIGGDIIQVDFDPLYELFIPLGGTLEEAIAKMEEIRDFYKQPRHAENELVGCFTVAYPSENLVPVKVTRRQILTTRILEFSLPVEGTKPLVRATHISRSDFVSMLTSLKLYKKIHPKEK